MILPPLTFGTGDRFARQGVAQLSALVEANRHGIPVHPVWNKSNREHTLIGSRPWDVRAEANAAVTALGWDQPYFVDADHISLATVEPFLEPCDFFTLDVAACIGRPAEPDAVESLVAAAKEFGRTLTIPGVARPMDLSEETVRQVAGKFLFAVEEAGRIYRAIARHKGTDGFVAEISMDETDQAQTPGDILLILLMLAREKIPVQTLAPKFTGRFNKGVDYAGDLATFEREFDEDLAVLAWGRKELGLPSSLKLSVHSGSDKFSLYPIINRLLKKHNCGVHVKTAGTTWLEEVIGLAEAGGAGLALAKEIYAGAWKKFDDLTAPYATVLDLDPNRLPDPDAVAGWDGERFAAALRHNPADPRYQPDFRQLLHVAFKIAAAMGDRYLEALRRDEEVVARNVRKNLLERHLLPLFR